VLPVRRPRKRSSEDRNKKRQASGRGAARPSGRRGRGAVEGPGVAHTEHGETARAQERLRRLYPPPSAKDRLVVPGFRKLVGELRTRPFGLGDRKRVAKSAHQNQWLTTR